jgi:hypothetical protein
MRSRWTFLAFGTVLGLAVGVGIGALVWSNDSVSSDVDGEQVVVTSDETTEPSPEPSPEEAVIRLAPKDFEIELKTLEKQCFGSAGCNVTFRIDPIYVGSSPLPDTGTIEVIYEVRGGEDSPQINTFTISGGQAEYDAEEFASTTSESAVLTARATEVIYTPELTG